MENFELWEGLPPMKTEAETMETKPDVKPQIPFLADLIKLEKLSKKCEDSPSEEGYSSQVCKDEILYEGQTGFGKVGEPVQYGETQIKDEPCDSYWTCSNDCHDNVQEEKSEFDDQHSQLVKQETFSGTLSEPTRKTEQIKEETEEFEIIGGSTGQKTENRDLYLLRTSTALGENGLIQRGGNGSGSAAGSKLSENDVHTSQKEDNCGVRSEGSEELYHCDVCGEKFLEHNILIVHKRTHTGSEKSFKCDLYGFSVNGDLTKHTITHTGEKPYKCNVCGKRFNHNSILTNHKITHTGEKPYKCDICGQCYSRKGDFKVHKRTHTGEKPYKCDVCGKRFSQNNSLRQHKRTHTGEKPYKCDICGQCYSSSGNFKVHIRIHTGEKPYKCDICGQCYSRNGNFKVHKRTHTGEKPYKCDVCGKRFSQIGILRDHKRTHAGEKPYKCDLCGNYFGHFRSLKKHIRSHLYEAWN